MTSAEEIPLKANGQAETRGEGDIGDALAPNAAYDYSAGFTRLATELVPAVEGESMLLFVLLARVARITSYDFEASVHRPEGLNYSSFFLVAHLAVSGPMDGSRLASASGMSRAAVSAMTKTLLRDGWIERSPSEHDRRSVVLALSEEGRSRIPALFEKLNLREQAWSASLSPSDRSELLRLLRLLVAGAPQDLHSRD